MTDIDEIKNRLPIEDLISQYINIKKAGSGFTALCPFHNEKTPSFNISPSRGIYKCFGCGESGDIFTFIEKMEGLNFSQALEKLAKQTGVEISNTQISSEEKIKKNKEKERLINLLDKATTFFQISLLQNEKAKKYLKKRGVDEKTVKKFRLGYAQDNWNSLQAFLKDNGFNDEEMLQVGLIKKNEQNKIYDRFRDRIIFPIFDSKNNPVAFSGRDLSGKENTAKYLNSPETIFFDKSDILYGCNFAKNSARKSDYFIVVEGQMDLIMSHKIGFKNTVATSGTSLTEKHLKHLAKFTKNLVFAFDSDKAGIEGAFRAMRISLKMGFDVKILDIPKPYDPADIILKDENEWVKIVKNSRNIIDFFIEKINLSDKNLKQKNLEMHKKIYPFIFSIQSPIEKGAYISKICQVFNVSKEDVESELQIVKNQMLIEEEKQNKRKLTKQIKEKEGKLEFFSENNIINKTKKRILERLTAIYFWQKQLKKDSWIDNPEDILDKIKYFTDKNFIEKILNFEQNIIDDLIFAVELIYKEKEKNALFFDLENYYQRLEENNKKEKISKLLKEINFLNDSEKKEKILKEIQELTK